MSKATIRIQTEPFDFAKEVELLSRGGAGAVATFTGAVRAEGGLTRLILQHYPGMTEQEIARQVDEAGRRWPLIAVTVIHRIGELKPGEQIVLVAVAAGHRGDAFAACEFLMDHLKSKAPFWKEERRGTDRRWVEAKASDAEALERWKPR